MAVKGLGSGSTNFRSGGVCGTWLPADPVPEPCRFLGGRRFADAEDASTGAAISPAPPTTTALRRRVRRMTPPPTGLVPARGEPCDSLASTAFPFARSLAEVRLPLHIREYRSHA